LTSLTSYLDLWDLVLEGSPLETKTGLIAKVTWQHHPYILKISSQKGDEKTAAALKHYGGVGAVRVLKWEKNATLLEKVIPGIPLSSLVLQGKDDQATEIMCEIIQKLHVQKKISEDFPSLEELQTSFDHYLGTEETLIPLNLVKDAHYLYKELLRSQHSSVLLHGDLHHDNVLYDGERGWLAIDPKGYKGDPVFEVGALLRNPRGHPDLYQNPERIIRRISLLHEGLGFEKERVIAWGFSQAVLAGIWSLEDHESPEWALKVAFHLRELLRTLTP